MDTHHGIRRDGRLTRGDRNHVLGPVAVAYVAEHLPVTEQRLGDLEAWMRTTHFCFFLTFGNKRFRGTWATSKPG
jgi:hypothetical protein